MKKSVIISAIAAVAVVGVGAYFFWNQSEDFSLENYQPTTEFQNAFAALDNGCVDGNVSQVTNAPSYDIEETVRILNGMEIAQMESTSLGEFLEFMARQDYSQVPQDVLQAKKRLFPIIERMRDLDKQYADLGGTCWMIMRSAGTGLYSLAKNSNAVGAGAAAIEAFEFGDMRAAVDVAKNLGIDQAKTAAFEHFEQQQELKKTLKNAIEEVHTAYVEYLAEYAPIYNKYMKKWNEICLYKDQIYLNLYAGKLDKAYNGCEKVLASHPNNKEALLLKAMSLVQIGSKSNPEVSNIHPLKTLELPIDSMKATQWNSYLIEADQILDGYLSIYPDRSAPALLIKGLLYRAAGDDAQAMVCFDQSSQEYINQVEDLKDMLSSYRVRANYLSKSAEGLHLLKLYRSTMEGFGMFSPNFQKAAYYLNNGKLNASKEEVFNHFFRRGNQGIYDCLLSDMEYCEQNLYESFKQMLIEQQYIDINIEPSAGWLESDAEATKIKVSVTNRSNINLENVRIFLCIHYTDMYKDDYDVVKVPTTKSSIGNRTTVDLGEVTLNYGDKKFEDIVSVRAIAMTDDQICWLDENSYKRKKAQQYYNNSRNTTTVDSTIIAHNASYLDAIDLPAEKLTKLIASETRAICSVEEGGLFSSDKKKMTLFFPRILTMLDPVFTAQAEPGSTYALSPCFNVIDGNDIIVQFDFEPKAGESYPFYICSKYLTDMMRLSYDGSTFSIEDMEIL